MPNSDLESFLTACVGGASGGVRRFETHGALVFVGPAETLKIKRPVRYSYMDFSSLAQRRHACAREVEVNAPNAPDIYLGLVAITREADGTLTLDGRGAPIEWAVRMRSFPQSDVLENRIAQGPFDKALLKEIGDMVARYHAEAPSAPAPDAVGNLQRIIADLDGVFATHSAFAGAIQPRAWGAGANAQMARLGTLLPERVAQGEVRRVHGDLHLGNIVLWHGVPLAFDAIEFDERIATIDTLYDLAFLLMDLDRHGHRDHANAVLERYLWRRQRASDIAGLAALPLFLSLRAGIRAMVTAQRADLETAAAQARDRAKARDYLAAAMAYLRPRPPVMIAVGGLSGTGKSTLAAEIAPLVGAAPGALRLRSDLERKALFGADETERLPASCYTREASGAVYARLQAKARGALGAGHSVIIDAVHGTEEERDASAALARDMRVAFAGLWLDAPLDLMKQRVSHRSADASDATVAVVEQQSARETGPIAWHRIETSADRHVALDEACAHLREKQMLISVEKS